MAFLPKGNKGKGLLNTVRRFTHASSQNHLGYTRDLPNQQPTWGFHGPDRRHILQMFRKILYFLLKII